jgi:hypothetical protein
MASPQQIGQKPTNNRAEDEQSEADAQSSLRARAQQM